MSTKIVTCDCKSPYQDKRYGAQKRVANFAKKQMGHRCTVCGKIHK